MATRSANYESPLDHLLTLGPPGGVEGPWRDEAFDDYGAMGIGIEHVPELRRMAFDQALGLKDLPDCYGPVHAARALGWLHPSEIIDDLIELTRRLDRHDDDMWLEDMPGLFVRFGGSAIDPLARVAGDNREKFGARLFFIDGLERIATEHPDARDRVVATLTSLLKYAKYNDSGINGHIVDAMIILNATEALPEIRSAFANGFVNETVCGPLEEVEKLIFLSREEQSEHHRSEVEKQEAELENLSPQEAIKKVFQRMEKYTK